MNSIVIKVEGMTCSSCEKRVESVAAGIAGVVGVKAEASKKRLTIELAQGANAHDVTTQTGAVLSDIGYPAGGSTVSVSKDGLLSVGIGVALSALFFALDHSGIISFAPRQGATIAALAASGLLTSFHCISMCGGIALSQALRTGSIAVSRLESLRSSIAYNAGRVVGYSVIGAIVGSLGAALDIGPGGRAAVMFAAAVFMAIMGLRLAGLIPAARTSRLSAFGRLRDSIGSKADGLGPFAVGLANALMPCGPLQAAQAFALASGSALAGALSMFAFSLGTVPLMLAFGAGGSLLSHRFRSMASRAGGILVLFLGVAAFGRAFALLGIGLPIALSSPPANVETTLVAGAPDTAQAITVKDTAPSGILAVMKNGFQEVSFDLYPRSYARIIVVSGIPVKWTIKAVAANINGCNNAIIVPAYKLRKDLVPGNNLIEFTPGKPGTVHYSCWMGMINSTIEVVAPNDPRLKPSS